MTKKDRQSVQILKVPIFGSSKSELLRELESWLEGEATQARMKLIFTPNPEILVEASEDAEFLRILQGADINIPDGVGIYLAGWLVGQTVSETIPGADLAHDLVRMAARRGWRVFLLGSRPGVASMAAENLKMELGDAAEGFEIAAEAGPTKVASMTREENERLVKRIAAFGPKVLLVGFGHKKQERWLTENRESLHSGVAVGVGGTFDFWAGRVKRAPRWVNRSGLEWLYRLTQEPWRWKRQLRLVKFIWLVLTKR